MALTAKELVEQMRKNGSSDEHIINRLIERLKIKQDAINTHQKLYKNINSALIECQKESGRRAEVRVDEIITSAWGGNFIYYRCDRYRYESAMKAWILDNRKDRSMYDYEVSRREGKFRVTILLPDKEMPRKFEGVAVGTLMGKKLIAVSEDTLWINSGDKFTITKKETNNG